MSYQNVPGLLKYRDLVTRNSVLVRVQPTADGECSVLLQCGTLPCTWHRGKRCRRLSLICFVELSFLLLRRDESYFSLQIVDTKCQLQIDEREFCASKVNCEEANLFFSHIRVCFLKQNILVPYSLS